MKKFKGTNITYEELTKWILDSYKKFKVTEIRYFGSRSVDENKTPREDSDIDVYVAFKGKSPDRGPIFTDLFKKDNKKYQIEIHGFMDFGDGFVPTHLIGNSPNELQNGNKK